MKKSIAILSMTLLASFSFAQQTGGLAKGTKTSAPINKTLQVASSQIDLGDNLELKGQDVQIKLKNVGTSPIQIRKISTTAFLEVKSQPTAAIQPGEEAIVIAKHIPNRDGQFLETLVVESDATNKMEVLKIFGTIAIKQASVK